MSYAGSLGKEEKRLYAKALENGSAVTYVDENGTPQKGTVSALEEMAEGYKTIYEEQLAANRAAAESAAEQTRLDTELAAKTLGEEYDSANKGLYRQYRKALASLPQELAAMGYTGGSSESSRVELESSYGENVGQNEREELAELARLRNAEAAALREGQLSADKADAAARREYLNALISLRERSYDDEQSRAAALAAAGDFSGYERLGYSSEEVERLRAAWEAKNPKLAIAIDAISGKRSAGEVAAMPAAWVKQYLNALGYMLRVNDTWDSATENAFRTVFGQSSGRYRSYAGYYSAGEKEEEKEEKTKKEKKKEKSGPIRYGGSVVLL